VKISLSGEALLAAVLALFLAALPGCRKLHRADFTPLDGVGFSYSLEEDLRTLDISDAEVVELAKAKRGGLTDDACVGLIRIARANQQHFSDGDNIDALYHAGMSEETILELARLNQLGLQTGEEQAMRLAGLSDTIVIELARRRAAGKSALSGSSLATLRNAGVSEFTMIELLRRGISDNQLAGIVALKRKGASDSTVLSRYPTS
jgi:hypothetical protein